MNIPKSWFKDAIEVHIVTNVKHKGFDWRGHPKNQYTFQLKKKYLKKICGMEFGIKEKVLAEESVGVVGFERPEEWMTSQPGYKRLLKYKEAIDKKLNGGSIDLRARALDALASNSSFEKDKFISDWLEQYGK